MQLQPPLALLADGATRFGGTEGPDLTRYLVVCAAIVAATGLVAFGFRRMIGGVMRTRSAHRELRVIDALALGSRQKLCVVRCYDRVFALGVGDREVNVIAELDRVVEHESEPAPVPPCATRPARAGDAERQAFADALEEVRRAMPGKRVGAPGLAGAKSVKDRLAEEVVA